MGFGDTATFVWGDVIKGVEETAANVTASMLNMNLGLQNSTCAYTQTQLIYAYHRPNLWAPYGVCISSLLRFQSATLTSPPTRQIALFVVALALVFGVGVFLRYNPDNLTTAFADTVGITRNRDLDAFARLHDAGRAQIEPLLHSVKFRLGDVGRGYIGYSTSEKFEQ